MSPRSPYSPYTPGGRRPALSMCSELDTIQSIWSEEPTSPHTPSPSSVADLPYDLGFSRRQLDAKANSYAATSQPACCVVS